MPDRQLWTGANRLAPRFLLVDLALAALSVYLGYLLTGEILASSRSAVSVAAAYTVAAIHGASVAVRRVAPVAAVVVLIATAAVYTAILGLPVFMLGPAVLFVAYGVGGRLSQRPAAILLAVVELALVVLLLQGPSFPGWAATVQFAGLIAGAWLLGVLARRWHGPGAIAPAGWTPRFYRTVWLSRQRDRGR